MVGLGGFDFVSAYAMVEMEEILHGKIGELKQIRALRDAVSQNLDYLGRFGEDVPSSQLVKLAFSGSGGKMYYPDYSPEEQIAATFYLSLKEGKSDGNFSISTVVAEEKSFVGSLDKLASDPKSFSSEELKTLCSFCTILGNKYGSLEIPFEERERSRFPSGLKVRF